MAVARVEAMVFSASTSFAASCASSAFCSASACAFSFSRV